MLYVTYAKARPIVRDPQQTDEASKICRVFGLYSAAVIALRK